MTTHHETVHVHNLDQNNLIMIFDVDYRADHAKVSCVITDSWSSNKCSAVDTIIRDVAEYEPGAFYKREMPCILKLLNDIPFLKPAVIVIDGYVHLGEDQHDGLGAHLYRALGETIPVVGVAKTYFHGTPADQAVLRNGSQKELYVSCIGANLATMKANVQAMHGEFRIPTLLKFVDQHCRA
jgi:deoxyribonuclease V